GGAERGSATRDPKGGASGRLCSQEIAQAGDDGERERGTTAARVSDGCGDARYLSVPQRGGDRVDRGLVEHVAIAAHHARQPLAGQLSCHRAPVGRGNRVVPRRELAPPDVDVAREGEPLRRHTGWPPAERDGGSD